ncbi:MAG: glutamate-5-semialdehyde dehydrogenase [Bacteriovoracaceae bacterium]
MMIELARKAKEAALITQSLPESTRARALNSIAQALIRETESILSENANDLEAGKKDGLTAAMMDRMTLSQNSLAAISESVISIANQDSVIGTVDSSYTRPNGLLIEKVRIPLGVIGMIFESRPNVVIDGAALAIKSGNSIILKGGKEAQHSNAILHKIVQEAIKDILPEASVQMVSTREDIFELLKLSDYIDLMVPRGGSALIQFVKKHATMPVVAHDKGLCHVYVHADADTKIVAPIVVNSKAHRPGVCNAAETLLMHKDYPQKKEVLAALAQAGIELRGDEATKDLHPHVKLATKEDYETEYLDKVMSVKIVQDEKEALVHIKTFGSHHTEAILARDAKTIELFLNSLDASCLVVNASTRFNDGGELGLGAELGISTSKLHAYGPMGAKEMTTTRFVVKGTGQIRS